MQCSSHASRGFGTSKDTSFGTRLCEVVCVLRFLVAVVGLFLALIQP